MGLMTILYIIAALLTLNMALMVALYLRIDTGFNKLTYPFLRDLM